jgi:hypothetical protein
MSAGQPLSATSISSFLSLNALQADVLVELLIESLLSRDISTKDEAVIQAVALCEQCLQLLHVQTTTTEVSQINNDTSETEVEVTSSAIEVWLDCDHADRMHFFNEGISDHLESICIHTETPDVDVDSASDDGCSVQEENYDVIIDLTLIYKSLPNIGTSLRCLKLINHMHETYHHGDTPEAFCDGGLEDLVFHLPQLEELFISRVGIYGDICCLGFLTNLSSLTLKYPRCSFYGGIRSGSIDSLASLTNLKHLQLYDDKFYGNLHSLNKLKRLEVLKLRGTKIEADGLHLPSLFPRLKILKLTDNPKLMGTFILSQTLKSVIFNNQNDITVDELSLMNLAKDCEIDLCFVII